MDQNNHNLETQPIQPTPAKRGKGVLVAHVANLVIILVIFLGTHYFLSANNCTPDVSFRVAVIAAILYGLLSTMLVVIWVRRKTK